MSIRKFFFPNEGKDDVYSFLDGMRGLAIIIVMLFHSSTLDIQVSKYINFNQTGRIGVLLFFVLSSYLLDRQIIKAFLSNKANFRFWLNYYARRFLRIYPLYITAMFAIYWLNKHHVHGAAHVGIFTLKDIVKSIFLVQSEAHFWSIKVEFIYYFVSPIILYLLYLFFQLRLLPSFLIITSLILINLYFRFTLKISIENFWGALSVFYAARSWLSMKPLV